MGPVMRRLRRGCKSLEPGLQQRRCEATASLRGNSLATADRRSCSDSRDRRRSASAWERSCCCCCCWLTRSETLAGALRSWLQYFWDYCGLRWRAEPRRGLGSPPLEPCRRPFAALAAPAVTAAPVKVEPLPSAAEQSPAAAPPRSLPVRAPPQALAPSARRLAPTIPSAPLQTPPARNLSALLRLAARTAAVRRLWLEA